jgi:hypothetical protein
MAHSFFIRQDFKVDLGYERFLAPEVLFNPGISPTAPPGIPGLPKVSGRSSRKVASAFLSTRPVVLIPS